MKRTLLAISAIALVSTLALAQGPSSITPLAGTTPQSAPVNTAFATALLVSSPSYDPRAARRQLVAGLL